MNACQRLNWCILLYQLIASQRLPLRHTRILFLALGLQRLRFAEVSLCNFSHIFCMLLQSYVLGYYLKAVNLFFSPSLSTAASFKTLTCGLWLFMVLIVFLRKIYIDPIDRFTSMLTTTKEYKQHFYLPMVCSPDFPRVAPCWSMCM